MIRAVEKVRQRLERATRALERAGIDYAVAGGNAVAGWVSRVDEAAVRNTQDVDILIRRDDLEAVKKALAEQGFVFRHAASIDMFLDGPVLACRSCLTTRRGNPGFRGAYRFRLTASRRRRCFETRSRLRLAVKHAQSPSACR